MRAISVLLAVAATGVAAQDVVNATGPTTGAMGNASVVEDNPPGAIYAAQLPDTAFTKSAFPNGGNVKGSIEAVANPNGIGVQFRVRFANLPPLSLGPFPYHIHDAPVPDNGNCTATLAHLDPFIRGEDPACDADLPQTCQVGDLSGKHKKITSDPYEATFVDEFASTKQGLGAFFGNRSFVIHFPNKTRITCANFKLVKGNAGSVASPLPSSTAVPNNSSTAVVAPVTSATPVGGTPQPSQTVATVSGAGAIESTVWAMGTAWLFTAIMFML